MTMKACLPGAYARGFYEGDDDNDLYCCSDPGVTLGSGDTGEIVDVSTTISAAVEGGAMRGCAGTRVMTGFHRDDNKLLCATFH